MTVERSSVPPRRNFRVLTRQRSGSHGGEVIDVQLQVRRTGALVWAQTFSDHEQARALEEQLAQDLDELDDEAFRRAHRVPSDT
jgi:ribosomal protein S7